MNSEQPTPNLNQEPQPGIRVAVPKYRAIVTYVLLGLNILLFLLQLLSEYVYGVDWLFVFGGKINDFILRGQIWRLITPAFLHSNLLHIGFNMYALLILGQRLERTYGHMRFLLLYFLAGLGGNVLSFVLSDANSLGSSTAIFGLLAAEAVFLLQNRKLLGQRFSGLLMNIGFILMLNLFIGFSPSSNIDNFGHLGGLLGGFIFASLAGPRYVIEGFPPDVQLKDTRTTKDSWLASVIVLIGFSAMAAIRFMGL